MTQINFNINKTGSRLNFIMSLAGINPVMGDAFRDPILEIIGPLSSLENETIDQIKKFINALPEKDRKMLIANSFLCDNEVYIQEKCAVLFELSDKLNDKFELYWEANEKKLLESKKVILEDIVKQKSTLNKAFNALNVLFYREMPEQKGMKAILDPGPFTKSLPSIAAIAEEATSMSTSKSSYTNGWSNKDWNSNWSGRKT